MTVPVDVSVPNSALRNFAGLEEASPGPVRYAFSDGAGFADEAGAIGVTNEPD